MTTQELWSKLQFKAEFSGVAICHWRVDGNDIIIRSTDKAAIAAVDRLERCLLDPKESYNGLTVRKALNILYKIYQSSN